MITYCLSSYPCGRYYKITALIQGYGLEHYYFRYNDLKNLVKDLSLKFRYITLNVNTLIKYYEITEPPIINKSLNIGYDIFSEPQILETNPLF
jgi:hypothetical protein